MYEPQHLMDLQDSTGGYGGGADPRSWLSGDDHSSLSSPTLSRLNSTVSGNVDRDLFKDLVEIVPLVQSLIDRKANTSFTRRGSMIYTKTPSRESLYRKAEAKGRNGAQSIPVRKHKELSKDVAINQDGCTDCLSGFSTKSFHTEKDIEELAALRGQIEDLQRKLSEKDELIKLTEISKNELATVHAKLDEIKRESAEKDSIIKSTELQLYDAKVKLADRQAAVEKLQWEAMNSNSKVSKLQEDLEMVEGEISTFLQLVQGLMKNTSMTCNKDYETVPDTQDLPSDGDELSEMEMQEIEQAREAYISAVAAAKINQDEESISAAASARSHLRSLVIRS